MTKPAAAIILAACLFMPAETPVAGPTSPVDGVITGVVRDARTGDPIPLANVTLEGTVLGAATDNSGRFRITGVPQGSYQVSVTVVGFKKETREIIIAEGRDVSLSIELKQAPIEIAPVIVTASRREQDAFDVPVSFSVITAGDIAKRNPLTPDDVLEYAPGVVVTESQVGVRGSSGFNRGAGSRLLLLVDGVPALAGDTGDIRWDLIPPDQIERIEIVKSAASSLYGSSALGGVINIVTRPVATSPTTRVRAYGGYYDDPYYPEWKWTSEWLTFTGIDVSHSRNIGGVGLLTAVAKKASDGYRRNSDYDRSSAVAKLTYSLQRTRFLTCFVAWALEKHGHSTEWKSQSDALDIDESAWHDRTRSEKLMGYFKLRTLMGSRGVVSSTVNWYHTDWSNDFHDVKDNARALKLGVSLQVDKILQPGYEATLGIEGWHTGVASTMFGDRQIGEVGTFAEARIRVSDKMSLTLGARYDTHRLNKDRPWQDLLSPRAALVFRTGQSSSYNISVGRGFRAPTIAEMFTSTTVGGFSVKPNPGLASESGVTYEAGWTGDLASGLRTRLAVFRSDYRDLIEPAVDASDDKIHFTNVHDANVIGAEAWVRTSPIAGLITLSSSYMYLSSEDEGTGEPLAYRSKHTAKASADIDKGTFSVGLDFIYRSRVQTVKMYETDERVPVYVTDLRGEVRLTQLRLAAKISNLFQYNYTEIERTLAPIRHFTLSLSSSL